MNLRQLEYFVACAEVLNFTRAAEKCFITQTAMTQQIRLLEKSLGVILFERDKHHVKLTRAGSILYKEAKVILSRSEAAIRLVRGSEKAENGHISVGFIRGYGHSDLANVLHQYHVMYPKVEISLTRDNGYELIQQLRENELDLVFTVAPYMFDETGIKRHLLKEYPLMVVLAADHPLSGKSYLTFQDLREEQFLILQSPSERITETEEAKIIFNSGGYLPKISSKVGEPETLLLEVAVGLGISILPDYILKHAYSRDEIKIIPLVKADYSAETLNFEVIWRTDRTNPAKNQLVDMVRNW